jgi:hypothetical protein
MYCAIQKKQIPNKVRALANWNQKQSFKIKVTNVNEYVLQHPRHPEAWGVHALHTTKCK